MPYLILGLAVVIGIVLLLRGFAGADPKVVLRILKWTILVIGLTAVIYLGVVGRLSLALWIGAALLPFFLRARALRRMARSWRGPSAGQTSDIETGFLRMQLDHDTGELRGTVLDGQFRGRLLEEMALAEQVALLQECRVHDAQGAAVLEAFLDRVHGAAWRGGEEADTGGGARASSGSSMTFDEAYEILGLSPGAKPDDIREAHRKLMQKNHPDHGGSTYLASKINQAKELLLGG